MKLFSATEVITNKEQQTAADLIRIKSVSKELLKKRQLLQEAENDFYSTLGRQEVQFEEAKAEFNLKIEELKQEVGQLEARKHQALIPIEERERASLEVAEKLSAKEIELKAEFEKVDKLLISLEERLSAVAEREAEAEKTSRNQFHAQNGINIQSELIKSQTAELNDKMKQSLAEIEEKNRKVLIREQNVTRKESALDDKVKWIMETEEGFEAQRRELRDKYATLEATIQEYKLKQQNG